LKSTHNTSFTRYQVGLFKYSIGYEFLPLICRTSGQRLLLQRMWAVA